MHMGLLGDPEARLKDDDAVLRGFQDMGQVHQVRLFKGLFLLDRGKVPTLVVPAAVLIPDRQDGDPLGQDLFDLLTPDRADDVVQQVRCGHLVMAFSMSRSQ